MANPEAIAATARMEIRKVIITWDPLAFEFQMVTRKNILNNLLRNLKYRWTHDGFVNIVRKH